MDSETAFEKYLDGAFETLGIEADETERAVMIGVWTIYEPGMNLLRDADVDSVPPELDVDLSRAPSR